MDMSNQHLVCFWWKSRVYVFLTAIRPCVVFSKDILTNKSFVSYVFSVFARQTDQTLFILKHFGDALYIQTYSSKKPLFVHRIVEHEAHYSKQTHMYYQ